MNILVAYRDLPWPWAEGYHLRILHIFRRLKEKGHRVHLLSLQQGPPQNVDLRALQAEDIFDSIHPVRAPRRRFLGRLFTHLGPDPIRGLHAEFPGYAAELQREIQHLQGTLNLDVAYVFGPWTSVWSSYGLQALPTLLDVCDSRSLYYQRLLEADRLSAWERWWTRKLWKRFQKLEAWSLARYATATVVSEEDRAALLNLNAEVNLQIIANGVEIPEEGAEPISGRMILFGNMDFQPNVDAAHWLVEEIFPRVKAHVPQSSVVLAGSNPAPSVLRLGQLDDVKVTGTVPSLVPLIQGSSVVVAPMRLGAGIKNKILEGYAAHRPVVATDRALGGLHSQVQAATLTGNTSEELAVHLVELLTDPEKCKERATLGQDAVRHYHSWNAHAAQVEELLEALC
ncbi:MAG: glycosyltransferase family 4 protein [Planctomycetes bacterium]|nr:glycosyltransferase family 4 protein [Planctomycetota bacterium]